MKGKLGLISFFIALSTIAFAQKVTISATADKQKILIGEPISLVLQATIINNQPVQWFSIDSIPHFEILNKSKIDSQLNGKDIELKQTYTLTSWDSGKWQLPSFHLPLVSGKTKPIMVDVTFTPFNADEDYHDVKDIMEVPGVHRITWYWYAIGAVLLLAFFILLFPIRKKKPAAVEATNEGAYKDALQQLEALKKQNLSERDTKLFYTQLINIFRVYLQKRKSIQSFSKTTDDLAVQIKTLRLPANEYSQLVQILQLSDFVKFAKYQPGADDNEAAFKTIKSNIVTIENE